MNMQLLKSGNKNKNGENYVSGVTVFITLKELKKANLNKDDKIKKTVKNGKIIIEKLEI